MAFKPSIDSRARSTKTRIETTSQVAQYHRKAIREQDPLKQGLKLQDVSNI